MDGSDPIINRTKNINLNIHDIGEVSTGNSIIKVNTPTQVAISDVVRLYAIDREDTSTMRRAVEVEALPEGWKDYFIEQIRQVEKN